jgi:hypothetical protein
MTATLDPQTTSTSRRALLAGALGGIGALAATVIGRADPVRAANGDPVTVGGTFTGTATTKITNTDINESAIWGNASNASGIGVGVRGDSASDGYGVWGISPTGSGVRGESTSGDGVSGESTSSNGVFGQSASQKGVFGFSSNNFGVHARAASSAAAGALGWSLGDGTGVYGYSGSALGPPRAKTGVYGYAVQDTTATGVRGESTIGVGVRGKATTGYAGFFDGRVFTTRYYELAEIATPNAPAANQARLFVRDNGAGKTQLCVRYNTGAVQVLNTQP